jgi:hypothetical protein
MQAAPGRETCASRARTRPDGRAEQSPRRPRAMGAASRARVGLCWLAGRGFCSATRPRGEVGGGAA